MDKEFILYQIKEFFKDIADIFRYYFKPGCKDIGIIEKILITVMLISITSLIIILTKLF